MEIIKIIITVVYALICVALTVIVLLQEGKSAGLTGAISGAADTYWGKNKGRFKEGNLEKFTKFAAIAFLALALLLNVL